MRGIFRDVNDAVPEGPEEGFGAIDVGIVDFSGCVGGFYWGGEGGDDDGKGGSAIKVGFDVVDGVLVGDGRRGHCRGCVRE